MSWMLRKLLDLLTGLTQRYRARKYATAARHMGRDAAPADTRRGFIIIQIDALAHSVLLEAIRQRYMPHLERLLQTGQVTLSRWRCGQPTNTPSVQAGILYGYNYDIPGFRWYEKERRASIVCKSPGAMAEIQRRISAGRIGLLTDGSSYVNMFDGGASLALFTLGAASSHRLFENVRGVGFLALFLLSPIRVLHTIGRALLEYAVHVWGQLAGLARPSKRRRYAVPSPFLHIVTDVLLREIQTFAAGVDIYRGTRSIYCNYDSYDDSGHHHGVDAPQAFRLLRGIDSHIHRIDQLRQTSVRRHYDLYVLSDHGLTPSMPFRQLYGETLGHWLVRQIGDPVVLDELAGDEQTSATQMNALIDELQAIEERLSPSRRSFLVQAIRRYVAQRVPPSIDAPNWDLARRGDIVVRSSGSCAHVYFNVARYQMPLSEIALLYPNLLQNLVDHPAIGLIVARNGSETVALSREGSLRMGVGRELEGSNPLSLAAEPDVAEQQVRYLASFPHSGDLIIYGGWHSPGVIVSFEDQISTHGGLGGQQDYPFLMCPGELPLDVDGVTNATDLYTLFASRYLADTASDSRPLPEKQ